MKNVIRLMIEEVKNLRSQVRIILYVSLKNIFEHDELIFIYFCIEYRKYSLDRLANLYS